MAITRIVVSGLCAGILGFAQTTNSRCQVGPNQVSTNVSCVIPTLFLYSQINDPKLPSPPDARGIQLSGTGGGHAGHFTDLSTPSQDYSQNFLPLNSSIATQLTLLPIPSPASGFVFTYDRAAGLSVPNPRTLGPILTERAETIGRGKIYVGSAYQRFRFSSLDDRSLKNLPIVFQHTPTGPANQDYITGQTSLDLKIDQVVFFGTVGITDRFDVSVAIPINDVRLGASAPVTINRVAGVPDPTLGNNQCGPVTNRQPCHFFGGSDVNILSNSYSHSGSATGLGDVTLRLKGNIYRPAPGRDGMSIALLTDVRLPSGDEGNFLGSGTWGVRPFLAVSFGSAGLSPHVNVGYQLNGSSLLATNNLTPGSVGHVPNQFFYSVGTDLGIIKDKLTVAGDIMGSRLFNAARLIGAQAVLPSATVPRIGFGFDDYSMNNASIGVKGAIYGHLLLTANLLLRLDNNGLRQRAVPLIGLSYGF